MRLMCFLFSLLIFVSLFSFVSAVCVDNDGDGYSLTPNSDCFSMSPDCDDTTDLRSPGRYELCHDGIDNDCDGAVDSVDSDCFVRNCTIAQASPGSDWSPIMELGQTETYNDLSFHARNVIGQVSHSKVYCYGKDILVKNISGQIGAGTYTNILKFDNSAVEIFSSFSYPYPGHVASVFGSIYDGLIGVGLKNPNYSTGPTMDNISGWTYASTCPLGYSCVAKVSTYFNTDSTRPGESFYNSHIVDCDTTETGIFDYSICVQGGFCSDVESGATDVECLSDVDCCGNSYCSYGGEQLGYNYSDGHCCMIGEYWDYNIGKCKPTNECGFYLNTSCALSDNESEWSSLLDSEAYWGNIDLKEGAVNTCFRDDWLNNESRKYDFFSESITNKKDGIIDTACCYNYTGYGYDPNNIRNVWCRIDVR